MLCLIKKDLNLKLNLEVSLYNTEKLSCLTSVGPLMRFEMTALGVDLVAVGKVAPVSPLLAVILTRQRLRRANTL